MGGWKVLEEKKYGDLIDSDEVSWIFGGYYFNLYFLRGSLLHQDWKDYEAFDHPPLVKYVVGGAIYLKGHTVDSIEPKTLSSFGKMVYPNVWTGFFTIERHSGTNISLG